MSKFKKDQEVTVNGKKYQVTECDGAYRRCRICQEHNGICPCINPDPTLSNKTDSDWSQIKCVKSIPDNCYLKPCGSLDN